MAPAFEDNFKEMEPHISIFIIYLLYMYMCAGVGVHVFWLAGSVYVCWGMGVHVC